MQGSNSSTGQPVDSQNGKGLTLSSQLNQNKRFELAQNVASAFDLYSTPPSTPSSSPHSPTSPRSSSGSIDSVEFQKTLQVVKQLKGYEFSEETPQDGSPSDANGTQTELPPSEEGLPKQDSTKISL